MYRITRWAIVTFGVVALCGCTGIDRGQIVLEAIAGLSNKIDETHQEADQQISQVSGTVHAMQSTVNTTFDTMSLRMLVGGGVCTFLAMFGYLFAKPIHEWRQRRNGRRERYVESMRKP